jgi:predicted DNA-binding protein (MmcQ/YjbR family)
MSRELVNSICQTLPGAEVSDPWGGGHDAWKVGGKMFALIGAMNAGVSVKMRDVESAMFLIELDAAERAPYLHASWVLLPWGRIGDGELRDRIHASYRIIRQGLPKKIQAALAPFPAA